METAIYEKPASVKPVSLGECRKAPIKSLSNLAPTHFSLYTQTLQDHSLFLVTKGKDIGLPSWMTRQSWQRPAPSPKGASFSNVLGTSWRNMSDQSDSAIVSDLTGLVRIG